MVIERVVVPLILLASLTAACSVDETSEPEVSIDDRWDELSSDERRGYVEKELAAELDAVRGAKSEEAWSEAVDGATTMLSLLRVEMWAEDRAAYGALETEVETLIEETKPAGL